MANFKIEGGHKLEGEVVIPGAKNAILPILAASVMNEGVVILKNCPDISDVRVMIEVLRSLGLKVSFFGDIIEVDGRNIECSEISDELAAKMRSSVFLMGPLVARCGSAKLKSPGGCAIGKRPIDIHIKAFEKLGASVVEEGNDISCKAINLKGNNVNLDFPSVGATENAMMLATACKGRTRITNCAKEPEIVNLAEFLNAVGCDVRGAGSSEIIVEGKKACKNIEFNIISDRIYTGTIMCMVAITGGKISIKNAKPHYMVEELKKFIESGCEIEYNIDNISFSAPKELVGVKKVETNPFPSFSTDMQSQFLAMLTTASTDSLIVENIFEDRFKTVPELIKMGADLKVNESEVLIKGVKSLYGTKVEAKDLRGGAALVIAGLRAEGETTVQNIEYIDRGYANLENILIGLGACIKRV